MSLDQVLAGLYADAGLHLVFIALAAYGWWTWTHGGGPGSDELPVARTGRAEWEWPATAVAAVDELLARGWELADPLPEKR